MSTSPRFPLQEAQIVELLHVSAEELDARIATLLEQVDGYVESVRNRADTQRRERLRAMRDALAARIDTLETLGDEAGAARLRAIHRLLGEGLVWLQIPNPAADGRQDPGNGDEPPAEPASAAQAVSVGPAAPAADGTAGPPAQAAPESRQPTSDGATVRPAAAAHPAAAANSGPPPGLAAGNPQQQPPAEPADSGTAAAQPSRNGRGAGTGSGILGRPSGRRSAAGSSRRLATAPPPITPPPPRQPAVVSQPKPDVTPAQIVGAQLVFVDRSDDPAVPREVPPPPARWNMERERFGPYLEKLTEQAENLVQACHSLDFDVLAAEVMLMVAKCRQVVEYNRTLIDSDRAIWGDVHQLFGRLSKICRDRLNPQVYVYGLSENHQADWSKLMDEARTQRAEAYRRLDREAQRQRELAEQREQTERRVRQNREQANMLLEELAETDDDPHRLALVREYLLVTAPDEPLLQAVASFADLFVNAGSEYRRLRAALRREGLLPDDEASGDGPRDSEPDDAGGTRTTTVRRGNSVLAAYRGAFRGLRVVMLGGSPIENRRAMIQQHLGFESLEWITNERTERANADALAKRIEQGRYDMLLYLTRFVGHHAQEHLKPACKTAGVPFVRVDTGYGITGICLALKDLGLHNTDDVARFQETHGR